MSMVLTCYNLIERIFSFIVDFTIIPQKYGDLPFSLAVMHAFTLINRNFIKCFLIKGICTLQTTYGTLISCLLQKLLQISLCISTAFYEHFQVVGVVMSLAEDTRRDYDWARAFRTIHVHLLKFVQN